MKIYSTKIIVLCALMLITACSTKDISNSKETITVFAASSLAPVLDVIDQQFESEYSGVSITLNKAGTQELRTQIEQGAKADILISARERDVAELKLKGLVESSEEIVSNHLVFIVSKEGMGKVKSIQDITQKGIKVILADEKSPIGEYSRKLIANLDQSGKFGTNFSKQFLQNVVSNENNEQNVLSKIVLGEADVGIVYQSSLVSLKKDQKDSITMLNFDQKYNVNSSYYLTKLKNASSMTDNYINWLKSNKGKSQFKTFGFDSN